MMLKTEVERNIMGREHGIKSCIDIRESIDHDYSFEKLTLKGKIRRKSCFCSYCSGSNLVDKKYFVYISYLF